MRAFLGIGDARDNAVAARLPRGEITGQRRFFRPALLVSPDPRRAGHQVFYTNGDIGVIDRLTSFIDGNELNLGRFILVEDPAVLAQSDQPVDGDVIGRRHGGDIFAPVVAHCTLYAQASIDDGSFGKLDAGRVGA